MIFDTHAHYDDEAFDTDRYELLTSMNENGICNIVNVGASMDSTKASVELSKKYDFMYTSVGVHPNETGELTENDMNTLRKLSEDKKVVAIGEIGLDYYFLEPDKDIQKKWFRKQLDVAEETGLPVIIHSRDAASDTMSILKEYQGKLSGGVIHCYSYSLEMAKEYIKMGYYIGIGGVVTFKNAKKLIEVAENIALENIVLETDCPYLSPEPNRGKRNDSTNLHYVVKKISELRGISEEEIIEQTYKNAIDLYKLN